MSRLTAVGEIPHKNTPESSNLVDSLTLSLTLGALIGAGTYGISTAKGVWVIGY